MGNFKYRIGLSLGAALVFGCAGTTSPASSTAANASHARSCKLQLSAGLDLVVLGSGGPRSAGRAASSYLVAVGGEPRYLIDAGPGAFARLGETGLDASRLTTFLLTHLHIDHTGDLPGLIKSRDLLGDQPVSLRVVGPSGRGEYPSTTAFIDRLFGPEGAYAYLRSFRNALTFDVTEVAMGLAEQPRRILDDSNVAVSAVAVDHAEVPALAYRLEYAGRSLVFTGDLASKQANIVALASGADVLVYDAAVLDPPSANASQYALHTTPLRIGEVAAQAGVKTLLLSHIPPNVDAHRDEVLRSVRRSFQGEVQFAEDCAHFPLAGRQ